MHHETVGPQRRVHPASHAGEQGEQTATTGALTRALAARACGRDANRAHGVWPARGGHGPMMRWTHRKTNVVPTRTPKEHGCGSRD
jgi:hypothetical protein